MNSKKDFAFYLLKKKLKRKTNGNKFKFNENEEEAGEIKKIENRYY